LARFARDERFSRLLLLLRKLPIIASSSSCTADRITATNRRQGR
jgi:hypothetical protein